MGFKAWRNLGALALAGASLVGCSNTPQKSSNAFTPPPGSNPYNMPRPGTSAPTQTNNSVLNGQPVNNGFPSATNTGVQPAGLPQGSGSLQNVPPYGSMPRTGVGYVAPGSGTPSSSSYNTTPYQSSPTGGIPASGNTQPMYGTPGAGGMGATGGPAPSNTFGPPPLPAPPAGGQGIPPIPTGFNRN